MSDLLEFRLLKYIAMIAETGNFTRAAEKLYLAQPSLSEQIKNLEDGLGIEIFERGRNRVEPSTILLGDHATKTAFTQLPLNEYKVIHLALHGYADPEFPDRSALVFAPQSSPADDGLLQVREIRTLPLNSDLVTLSACDTGVGPVGEEGVANIVNAFIEAGAQSVVSTLWEMEDRSTAQLMIAFYRHLSQREGKAEALREAQLELLKSSYPPYNWAGFELDGEPNAALFSDAKSTPTLRSSR